MLVFVIGLVGFLGIHSIRIVAEPTRARLIERLGDGRWKAIHSAIAFVSLLALMWGYSIVSLTPTPVWSPPRGMAHATALFTLVAFVLYAAVYVPKNGIKARVHHPMTLAVKTWAFAHLLANGSLEAMLLFGSFLVWSVLAFRAARLRDRAAGTTYPSGTTAATIATVALGVIAWAAFAFWLHGVLIGVRPFGV